MLPCNNIVKQEGDLEEQEETEKTNYSNNSTRQPDGVKRHSAFAGSGGARHTDIEETLSDQSSAVTEDPAVESFSYTVGSQDLEENKFSIAAPILHH